MNAYKVKTGMVRMQCKNCVIHNYLSASGVSFSQCGAIQIYLPFLSFKLNIVLCLRNRHVVETDRWTDRQTVRNLERGLLYGCHIMKIFIHHKIIYGVHRLDGVVIIMAMGS